MRIGDAAAAVGATPRALRFYEQRGLLPPPVRTASGQREYGPDDLARIRVIRELLALGLTIEDIRTFASRLPLLTDDSQPRCPAFDPQPADSPTPDNPPSPAAAAVAHRLAALDAEIARLTHLRNTLAKASTPPPRAPVTPHT
ncbi:MerR family transcriptional regulator [Yinghuangia sp. YIM S09857]|uniref:MerR family transcriptional regulator n=1 Tax=Yinghuangia sp. YIM S09857 TaxID=3436929 RepID=UPI003F52FACB